MYFGLLGPEVFQYVEALSHQCDTEGCAGDLLIVSGGVGELLNSTLIDSFRGVRCVERLSCSPRLCSSDPCRPQTLISRAISRHRARYQ